MGINVEATRSERLKDNIRTIILSYLPGALNSWNDNACNNSGQENFEIISAHKRVTVNEWHYIRLVGVCGIV